MPGKIMPPEARSIPAAKKLIVFALLVGGLLLGLGWHLGSTSLHRYQVARHLSENGVVVYGTVTGERGALGNFGMTYTLRYDYRPAAGVEGMAGRPALSGVSEVSVEYFRAAMRSARVPVHYDAARPEVSMLDLAHNGNRSFFWPAFLFGNIFLLAGAAIVVGLLYTVWRPRVKGER